MRAFEFWAKVVRIIDGDTVLVDPPIYPGDQQVRIRLKYIEAPERGEPGYNEFRDRTAKRYPVGSWVKVFNNRVHWTHNRLEAHVQGAV